jgi:hypothetical protein
MVLKFVCKLLMPPWRLRKRSLQLQEVHEGAGSPESSQEQVQQAVRQAPDKQKASRQDPPLPEE